VATVYYRPPLPDSRNNTCTVPHPHSQGSRLRHLALKSPRHPVDCFPHYHHAGTHIRGRNMGRTNPHGPYWTDLGPSVRSIHIPRRHHEDQQVESLRHYESSHILPIRYILLHFSPLIQSPPLPSTVLTNHSTSYSSSLELPQLQRRTLTHRLCRPLQHVRASLWHHCVEHLPSRRCPALQTRRQGLGCHCGFEYLRIPGHEGVLRVAE
jgi:hypothetical protein